MNLHSKFTDVQRSRRKLSYFKQNKHSVLIILIQGICKTLHFSCLNDFIVAENWSKFLEVLEEFSCQSRKSLGGKETEQPGKGVFDFNLKGGHKMETSCYCNAEANLC